MPCRGSKYVNSEFNDILDQLREIINKYSPKYQFVLCGDWNCDISSRSQNIKLSERQAALKNFLQETNLTFNETDVTFIHPNETDVTFIHPNETDVTFIHPNETDVTFIHPNETDVTFIHPNGQEVSTIDYIFRSNEIDPDLNLTKRLDMLPSNTSDHHPIHTTIQCHFESKIKKVEKNPYPSKVNWSKIDLENLPSIYNILDEPPSKLKWKNLIRKAIDTYWVDHVVTMSVYYKSISYISTANYNTGHLHNALASIQTSAKYIQRLPIKLRLLTGTYILQCNRAAFNQIDIDLTCLLCEEDSETLYHFIHSCPALASARNHHMLELSHILNNSELCVKCRSLEKLDISTQLILDASALLCKCQCKCGCDCIIFHLVEYISRKLCFNCILDVKTLLLAPLPTNKKKTVTTQQQPGHEYLKSKLFCFRF
ncbi:unnamed protein product [Mytilus edulis]|uniref:Endonuclease/exonuclease/phosphatase domain-containing protein n=1 Tax=Mytilus edulis TaxID=6550 RepID=A0A8S3QGS1_MYTED|nr:unnamed protein product [Mytilus edulis]